MIDIKKAKKVFENYVAKYDIKNEKILLKVNHIYRVAEITRNIAISLKLSQEDVNLAELIGLLHDIGRFEQVKRYNTFNDHKSIDHGKFAVDLLFNEGLIKEFDIEEKYYDIIKKAVYNHNKSKIEEGLNEKELLHSKIIRDGDKIDIYYVLLTDKTINTYNCADMSKETFSENIVNDFFEKHLIEYKNRKTYGDLWVCHIAYIFDFYYKKSYLIIKEKKYLDLLLKKMNFQNEKTKKIANKMIEYSKNYLEQRCSE